jgi:hypothetical protein
MRKRALEEMKEDEERREKMAKLVQLPAQEGLSGAIPTL